MMLQLKEVTAERAIYFSWCYCWYVNDLKRLIADQDPYFMHNS